MTYAIDLPRFGRLNRTNIIAEVRLIYALLVASDSDLKGLIPSNNGKFEALIPGIRKVLENAVPIEADRSATWLALYRNTNWSNHGEKDKKYPHTDVNEEHCDDMLVLFLAFAEEHIKMRNALRDAVPNLEKVVAEAADDVEALDKALAVAKKADVADDHDAVQRGQRARAAAAKKIALPFTNCVKDLSGEGNLWIPEASIHHYNRKIGRTDKEALKTSKFYAIQIGLVEKGTGSQHNYIRLTGVADDDEEDEEATVVAEDN